MVRRKCCPLGLSSPPSDISTRQGREPFTAERAPFRRTHTHTRQRREPVTAELAPRTPRAHRQPIYLHLECTEPICLECTRTPKAHRQLSGRPKLQRPPAQQQRTGSTTGRVHALMSRRPCVCWSALLQALPQITLQSIQVGGYGFHIEAPQRDSVT